MKEILIIAGPNGSGKSTLAGQLALPLAFINADLYERKFFIHVDNKLERENLAAIAVAHKIKQHISKGESFAFETVFALNKIPQFLRRAKQNGFKITIAKQLTNKQSKRSLIAPSVSKSDRSSYTMYDFGTYFDTLGTKSIRIHLLICKLFGYIHFVAIDRVSINLERIAKRVTEGGHDVPKNLVIERYSKSLAVLDKLIDFSDEATVYDNTDKVIRPFLIKENNQIKLIDAVPLWAALVSERLL